ncbi:MAG: BspA family leucine-rich repeat surface protein [Bacteroidetes bacterium]|uniref:BspA family leucine-rich repeat surface protein n=1 Tax=Candidatus Cryptobacteroides faecipullorum TaxID=2840764 RepID=A0A9D9I5F6_9BACT|nr:BspA family leucine-rich repeat surface protein [Candidatus Cryptobacteroides faecipullorum]
MKKFLLPLLLCLCACSVDELQDRIDGLDERLTALEAQVEAMNTEISGLKSLIEGKQFISGIRTNEDGGFTLELVTDTGVQSEITVQDGADGHSPRIGVADYEGEMYWTLDGEFIEDGEGNYLPVSGKDGITPEFKIEDGMWYVSYGGEWQECGKAQEEAEPSIFKSAVLSDDGKFAYITLQDDTVLTFEVYRQFGILFDSAEGYVEAGASVTVPFVLTGADENTVIETIASSGWTAEVEVDDSMESGSVIVAAPGESSTGKVIVLVNDGGYKTIMRTLTFISGTLNISTSSVEAPATGGVVSVEVETDMEYEVEIPEDAQNWISFVETRSGMRTETVSFQVSANGTGMLRQTEVRLVSSGTVVETILVYQIIDYDKDLLVFRVKAEEYTSSSASKYSNQVYLPLFGEVAVTVNWGDGSREEIQKKVSGATSLIYHEYAEPGTYYVTVGGRAEALKGTNVNKNIAPAITGVIQWGSLGVNSLMDTFKGNTSLTSVPQPEEGAFAAVTTADGMFDGCTSLVSVPENLFASATALTDAGSLFNGCSSLKSVPENLLASCPLVTDVASMFAGCGSLEEVPSGLLSRQTEVTSLANLFKGCSALKTVPEDLFANQSKVKNLGSLFTDCSSLESVPAGLFKNLDAVTAAGTMFKGCSALKTVPEGLFDAFGKVTNISSLFSGCSSLGNLPAGIFRNMSAVTSAGYLYEGCVGMTDFPPIKNMTSLKTVNAMWKDCATLASVPADYFPESVSTGTTTAYMFQNCTSLKTVPEGLFDDFSNVTIITQMFQNCTSLESLPVGIFDNMKKIKTAKNTFEGCSAFTGESPYTIVGDRKIHLYERSADNGFTEITGYDDCFTGCGKMADYTYIPISWGGISDGTTGVPVLELSMVPSEGEEYFRFDISIKGADVKSCRYVLGETETVQSRLEEMGDYEKLCNRYGTAFSSSVIGNINSPEGHTVSSSDNLEPATEYTLVVMAGNVHGNTVETCVAVTGDVPEGEAGYERYIGTWTVTSASSEITGKPQTFTVEIEPYRVNESFRVSGWGITGFGSRDIAPFLMDYSGGNVSVSTYGYYGMYNLYYVYLKYRFKKEDGLYYVWTTDEDLATGTFGDDGTVTIEMSGFTDPASGNTYQVSGMDYFLYSGGKFYEVENMFKPGYTVSDYSIGPYVLTKSGSEQTRARKAASASPAFVELETVSLPVIPVRQGASEVLR